MESIEGIFILYMTQIMLMVRIYSVCRALIYYLLSIYN